MNSSKKGGVGQTNSNYWEQVLTAPTPEYQKLFDAEKDYLTKHIKPDSSVLDVGCSEGRNIRTILESTLNVTGIDNDPKAVNAARKNFKEISTVKIIDANATSLPFADGTFDMVALLMILPNLDKNKTKTMEEASRVLKKGGSLILSTFSEDAFDERMKVYKMVNVSIKRVEGTKVIFDASLGANVSEQFSKKDLEKLGQNANLVMVDCVKIGTIAYMCRFEK